MVDDNLRPLKTGSTHLCVPVCAHEVVSSKPASVGRDTADLHTHTNCGCVVCNCGSVCCKTCSCISQGSTFVSNVTKDPMMLLVLIYLWIVLPKMRCI